MKVLEEKEVSKGIHYGDGYQGREYRFDEPITRDQFISFCESEGYDMSGLENHAWYQDHAKVEKPGERSWFPNDNPSDVWVYKWVRVYTD